MTSPDAPLTTADLAAGRTAAEDEPMGRDDAASEGEGLAPLLAGDDAERFRTDWEAIQVGFVDDPQTSVERADALVAELMRRLATTFAKEREALEQQWAGGEERTDTEELRQALRRYRSFFERLLSA